MRVAPAPRCFCPVSYTHLDVYKRQVSSNAWDVIGAKAAGLRGAWVKRQPDLVFDPWDVEPDVVVSRLDELPVWFASDSNASSAVKA